MVFDLSPQAFSILAIYLLFMALGIGSLAGQLASPKPAEELPAWNRGTGMFVLFAINVLVLFIVTPYLISFLLPDLKIDISGNYPELSPKMLLASFIAQVMTAIAICSLLKTFSSGYVLSFPNIRKIRLFQWKPGYVFLGCVAITGIAGWGVSLLQKTLEYFLGIAPSWDKQQMVEMLMDNRGNPPFMVLIFMAAIIGAPIWEELFFRGCVYRFFKGIQNKHLAAATTGILFALIHFNALSFIPLALLGAYLCYAYERTGDIRVPIIIHALFNLNSFLMMMLAPELSNLV